MKQSSKHLNVDCLADFSKALKSHNPSNDFELLFVTGAGIILAELETPLNGHPTLDDYVENMTDKTFNLNAVGYLKHEVIERLKAKDEVAGDTVNFIGDGSMVFLKNVRFYHQPNEAPYLTLDSFVLHSDDIIGFSLVAK